MTAAAYFRNLKVFDCWTELGEEQVGVIQSLISTCKLHDVPFVKIRLID